MSYTDIMAEELQKAARRYALACHTDRVESENTVLTNKVEALERKIEEQKSEIDTLRELIGDLNRENDRVWNENINLSDRLKNLTKVLLKNFYITAEWDKQRSVWCLKLNDDGRKRHDQHLKHIEEMEDEVEQLHRLVKKNYYIAVSERDALKQANFNDDVYLTSLDATIDEAKTLMRSLGIEVDV